MNIFHRLLLAITGLFLFSAALAQDETGYAALTNAGYVSVSTTVEVRSPEVAEKTEVYRDQLIIEDTTRLEGKPRVSSSTEYNK